MLIQPVKEASKREFDRYFKKFDLGSHASSIAETLDAGVIGK
jgi:hypothetical protein